MEVRETKKKNYFHISLIEQQNPAMESYVGPYNVYILKLFLWPPYLRHVSYIYIVNGEISYLFHLSSKQLCINMNICKSSHLITCFKPIYSRYKMLKKSHIHEEVESGEIYDEATTRFIIFYPPFLSKILNIKFIMLLFVSRRREILPCSVISDVTVDGMALEV